MAGGRWPRDRGDLYMLAGIGTFYPDGLEGATSGATSNVANAFLSEDEGCVLRSITVLSGAQISIENRDGSVTYANFGSTVGLGLSFTAKVNMRLPTDFRVVATGGAFSATYSQLP